MPTYLYICEDENCLKEFEEYHSMSTVLEECPLCHTKGKLKKLINTESKGVVQLTGNDLSQKIKADAKELKRKVYTNENTLANVVGETKYNNNLKASKED